MVGAEDLEVAELEAVPQRRPVPRIAKRRGAHVLCALESFPGEVLVFELEVLGTGLGVDGLATLVGEVDGFQGWRARDVDDQDGGSGDLGQPYRPVGRLGLYGFGTG